MAETKKGMRLGVVIPTLNEAQALPSLLGDLGALERVVPLDIIVADGGSTDRTVASALVQGARVVAARRGRAHQLNEGARAARGEWLLSCTPIPDSHRTLRARSTPP